MDIKKKKHNKKLRKLEGNEKIAKELNNCIDKMIETRAAVITNLKTRHELTGQSSDTRKHFKEDIEKQAKSDKYSDSPLLDIMSNYGTLTVLTKRNLTCTSKSMVNSALSSLRVEYEAEIDLGNIKNKLCVDTDELKIKEIVMKRVDEYNKYLNKLKVDCVLYPDTDGKTPDEESVAIIKKIASLKAFQKYLYEEKNKYLAYYNRMKDIFEKESTTGTFPRFYSYEGVTLTWDDICVKENYYQKVKRYLENKDLEDDEQLFDKFEKQMNKLRKEQNKYTIKILLDGYDYDSE